jgi:putative flavoprotein involved in K+ transport
MQRIETLIVGGGQAGLSASYWLTKQGREHLLLEQAPYVASAWRDGRWDSFTLVTPNWTVQLPGFHYAGSDPDGFMARAEVVSYFEQYVASFNPPVEYGRRIVAIDRVTDGYHASTAQGDVYAAANVIIATGSFQFPKPNPLAQALPNRIVQLHSSQYRRPAALPPGAVLIVGSGETGCQLTDELYASGRQVFLCASRSGRRPRRYRGKDFAFWSLNLGKLNQTVEDLPDPGARFAANVHATGKDGGRTLNMHQFARDGVVLLGRLMAVEGETIALAPDLAESLAFADSGSDNYKQEVDEFVRAIGMDVPEAVPDPVDMVRSDAAANSPATLHLQSAGITTVIWANGYGFDYSWINLPILDRWGYPIQRRGVTQFPGLYFLGLNFLHYRKSGILIGVGDDAAHVIEHITGTSQGYGASWARI